ncbi:MAG: hypothetical protein K9L62_00505 [Vallitaleaceae bacterium]|nr:hypothetical protein [Vallitaleaceae bacterium]
MIIIEKNVGQKIPYSVNANNVTFDDDLTINLASREQDWPVHIDICYDEDHALVVGAAAGRSYVAQIDIPARQYTEEEVEGEIQKTPISLDMNTVTLTLWSIE